MRLYVVIIHIESVEISTFLASQYAGIGIRVPQIDYAAIIRHFHPVEYLFLDIREPARATSLDKHIEDKVCRMLCLVSEGICYSFFRNGCIATGRGVLQKIRMIGQRGYEFRNQFIVHETYHIFRHFIGPFEKISDSSSGTIQVQAREKVDDSQILSVIQARLRDKQFRNLEIVQKHHEVITYDSHQHMEIVQVPDLLGQRVQGQHEVLTTDILLEQRTPFFSGLIPGFQHLGESCCRCHVIVVRRIRPDSFHEVIICRLEILIIRQHLIDDVV